MAFAQNTFAPLSANSSAAPRVWTYQTDDTLAVVITAGYFIDKKFQLGQFDFIIAVVDGVLVKLVVGADTSTVTASNTVTVTSYFQDTDTGNYVISAGTATPIGLSLVVPIDAPDTEDYEVSVALPSVLGSTGNTQVLLAVDVDGSVVRSVTRNTRATDLVSTGVDLSFFVLRGSIASTGNLIVTILVTNLLGTVTIDNADGASLSVVRNKDVLI